MSISEKLNTISTSLGDIKDAIIDKGQTPTGNITTYADAIANISGGGQTVNNQDITINNNGVYTADPGYTGLGQVTVDVPQEGIIPSGTITITENGRADVRQYRYAYVHVPSGGNLGTKTITSNGTYSASSDNLDGFSEVTVNVSGGGTMPSSQAIADILGGTLSGDITLDNSVTKLKDYSLSNQSGMTGITAPSVTSVGSFVFQNCISLNTINLPSYTGPVLDETTGLITDNNELFDGYVPVQTLSIPSCTFLPKFLGNNPQLTVTHGTLEGVGWGNASIINSENIDIFSLKSFNDNLNEINNSYFDYSNFNSYLDNNGILNFNNLISTDHTLIYSETYDLQSPFRGINFAALKAFLQNNNQGGSMIYGCEFENETTFNLPHLVTFTSMTPIFSELNKTSGNNNINIIFGSDFRVSGGNRFINQCYLKKLDLSHFTSNGSSLPFQFISDSNIIELDLSSATTMGFMSLNNNTINKLDLSSITSLDNNGIKQCTINDLITEELSNITGIDSNSRITNLVLKNQNMVGLTNPNSLSQSVTNVYVPDSLVPTYEADPNWSQLPQGTIKPMSDWSGSSWATTGA